MIKYPESVKKIAKILADAGFRAYAVGGCIRDSVMGKQPNDWDMTTSARPDDMLAVFDAAGVRTVPTGLKHGTVTVLMDGQGFECTSFRIDGSYTDSRHPDKVTFTSDVAEDLKRRDFTVNAMAGDPLADENGIIDLFGGREDIEKGVIRCVGQAEIRFGEDALRILRAVRFASVLGFEIDQQTKSAAVTKRDGLASVSAERKKTELEKTLLSDNADAGVSLLFELGLAELVHPDLKPPCVRLSSLPKSFTCRLAALFGCDTQPCLSSMKLSRLEEKQIKLYCSKQPYFDGLSDKNARRLLSVLGECAEGAAMLRGNATLASLIADERAKKPPICIADLAVNGNEVISAGVPPRAVGEVMSSLLSIVIDEPSLNAKDTLLAHAKRIYKEIIGE